jgi:hypothetical protein
MARAEITGRKPNTVDRASNKATPIRGPPLALSIRDFCALHSISEDLFFKMRREGWGPAWSKPSVVSVMSVVFYFVSRPEIESQNDRYTRARGDNRKPLTSLTPLTGSHTRVCRCDHVAS